MTPCSRGCCWVPMDGVCGKQRGCPCHANEDRTSGHRNSANTHPDPTANQAIGNVMKEGRP